MRHRYKKVKITKGIDANKAYLVKSIKNFLHHGHLTTTQKRARIIKKYIDQLVYKAKNAKQSDINVILKYVKDKKYIEYLLQKVVPNVKRDAGFVKFINLNVRQGDGASMSKISWVDPIEPFEARKIKKQGVKDLKNQNIKEIKDKNQKEGKESKKINK